MSWPTDAELLARTDVVLRPGADTPSPDWLAVTVADCNAEAKTEVLGALAGRGFSPAQILAWVTGPGHAIVLSQALFFFACKATTDIREVEEQRGQGHSYLDRRPFTMTITDADGNEVIPEAVVRLGGVGHGRLKDTPREVGSRFYNRRTGGFRKW